MGGPPCGLRVMNCASRASQRKRNMAHVSWKRKVSFSAVLARIADGHYQACAILPCMCGGNRSVVECMRIRGDPPVPVDGSLVVPILHDLTARVLVLSATPGPTFRSASPRCESSRQEMRRLLTGLPLVGPTRPLSALCSWQGCSSSGSLNASAVSSTPAAPLAAEVPICSDPRPLHLH